MIDSSASMRDLINKVIQTGQIIVRNKYEKDEVFIIRFISGDKVTLMQDWTTDKDLLHRTMNEFFVEGGQTAVIDAVYLGVEKIIEH